MLQFLDLFEYSLQYHFVLPYFSHVFVTARILLGSHDRLDLHAHHSSKGPSEKEQVYFGYHTLAYHCSVTGPKQGLLHAGSPAHAAFFLNALRRPTRAADQPKSHSTWHQGLQELANKRSTLIQLHIAVCDQGRLAPTFPSSLATLFPARDSTARKAPKKTMPILSLTLSHSHRLSDYPIRPYCFFNLTSEQLSPALRSLCIDECFWYWRSLQLKHVVLSLVPARPCSILDIKITTCSQRRNRKSMQVLGVYFRPSTCGLS